jgi:hypothetical protein
MYPIQSITVSGSTTSQVDFTSIPQTFTHLQVRCFWNTTSTSTGDYILALTANGDGYPGSGTYTKHWLLGNGSSAVSGAETSTWSALGGELGTYGVSNVTPNASTFSTSVVDVLDYTNTNKYKTFRLLYGTDYNGSGTVSLSSGMRMNTAAITQLSLFHSGSGGYLRAGSTFQLYGISTSSATGA